MTSGFHQTDYVTVAQLKAQLRIADTTDDAAVQIAVTSASRAVDQYCKRQFGITGSAVARLYTYEGAKIQNRPAVAVDDLQDLTTGPAVFQYDATGTGSYIQTPVLGVDIDLWPWNAAADNVPYTHIVQRLVNTSFFIPYWTRGVKITANFGWSTVPVQVVQATLIQAARFFVRRDSAYGVAGSPDLGSELRLLTQLDPDVQTMLRTVKRDWAAS